MERQLHSSTKTAPQAQNISRNVSNGKVPIIATTAKMCTVCPDLSLRSVSSLLSHMRAFYFDLQSQERGVFHPRTLSPFKPLWDENHV